MSKMYMFIIRNYRYDFVVFGFDFICKSCGINNVCKM